MEAASDPARVGSVGSGFHLWWQGVPTEEPVTSCSVVLEVLVPPAVPRCTSGPCRRRSSTASGRSYGAAHTGSQWNPRHPGSRAVNWGGYAQAADVGSVLEGSDSPSDGIPGDRNTRNYAWLAGVPYRFTIHPGIAGWAATVTDLATGSDVTIRELYAGGDRLGGFVMWSELFCRGADPSTAVRWSQPAPSPRPAVVGRGLHATFPDGREWRNLDVVVDEVGAAGHVDAPDAPRRDDPGAPRSDLRRRARAGPRQATGVWIVIQSRAVR